MARFFRSTSSRWASTSAFGTCRCRSSRNSSWVRMKRVSFCHSVSSPSRPRTVIGMGFLLRAGGDRELGLAELVLQEAAVGQEGIRVLLVDGGVGDVVHLGAE